MKTKRPERITRNFRNENPSPPGSLSVLKNQQRMTNKNLIAERVRAIVGKKVARRKLRGQRRSRGLSFAGCARSGDLISRVKNAVEIRSAQVPSTVCALRSHVRRKLRVVATCGMRSHVGGLVRDADESCNTTLLEILAAREHELTKAGFSALLACTWARVLVLVCDATTRPVCFHIESKYEVKYGSSVLPLFRSVFFPCHRFAEKPFYHDVAISYINIVPAALREIRQVDGVRGEGLRIFRYYSASITGSTTQLSRFTRAQIRIQRDLFSLHPVCITRRGIIEGICVVSSARSRDPRQTVSIRRSRGRERERTNFTPGGEEDRPRDLRSCRRA